MSTAIDKTKINLMHNQYTWLITGVAGFIGSHLLEALLKLKQKVIGIDNFFTGHQKNIDDVLRNLPQECSDNFHFCEMDIRSFKDCDGVMQGVDYVLHHAALGNVPYSIEDPLITNAINVDGFLNILTAAKNNHIKRVVYASSSAVYGDSPGLPKSEDQVVMPLSPYAVSKYTNELYAEVFARCYDMEIIGLRYFNVFGPRQDPHGAYTAVIPLWVKSLCIGEEVFVNGDGETTRDFCYIENVVQANLLAGLIDNLAVLDGVYNIALGQQISLNELFIAIRSVLGIAADIAPKYREFRAGDVRYSLADITKAQKLLGYEPSYGIVDGLKRTIDWHINGLSEKT